MLANSAARWASSAHDGDVVLDVARRHLDAASGEGLRCIDRDRLGGDPLAVVLGEVVRGHGVGDEPDRVELRRDRLTEDEGGGGLVVLVGRERERGRGPTGDQHRDHDDRPPAPERSEK
jgi:hypothetical protein